MSEIQPTTKRAPFGSDARAASVASRSFVATPRSRLAQTLGGFPVCEGNAITFLTGYDETIEVTPDPIDPAAITSVALLTIEGELDDISGQGQTRAAHDLCSSIAKDRKHHYTAAHCGHYGIFSGRRWRETICPKIAGFIRSAT